MADEKYRRNGGPADAVEALQEVVSRYVPPEQQQRLMGQFSSANYYEMLRRDAALASIEIQQSIRDQRESYIRRMHDSGRIDRRYTFNSIQVDNFNQAAVNVARAFCASAPQLSAEPVILLIQGGEGSGKSVLCHAIANFFLEHGRNPSVEMISLEDLNQANIFNSTDEKEDRILRSRLLERYNTVNLLLLDELCPNRRGLSLFEQKNLSTLLKARLHNRLSMVITLLTPFSQLHDAIGNLCFESLKSYSVLTTELYGSSRRAQILVNGRPLR